MIGRTLSHYKITSRLGAGGMGEVYLAEDLDLGRAVALKVLPPEVASDGERLARFRREARTLAALSHPGIVTVFSIEEAEGVAFLTMERVDGETLDRLIPRRGFGLERFFEIALPLVDAVASAHAKGVVHRDLKPSNVMVGKDGRVKVLDFGLAKPRPGEAAAGSEMSTDFLTAEHKIVGTLAYMSPEQLQGKPADPRSDIFSLGILLYQMATGRSPFAGSSSVEVASSILRERPPTATELRASLPPRLARIVDRCLRKNPEERHQSARDLGFALEELREELATGETLPSAGGVGRAAGRPLRALPLVAALVVVGAVFGLWLWRSRPAPDAGSPFPETQLAAPVVTWPSEEKLARLSPDGEWLSFVSDREGSPGLWIQRVEGGVARALTEGSRAVQGQVWSPSGDEIAVLARVQGQPRLEILPAPLGGRARLSLAAPEAEELVDWIDDRVLMEDTGRLLSYDLERAEAVEVPIADPGFEHMRHFDAGADGSTVVFSALLDGRENLWALATATGEVTALTDDAAKQTHPQCLGERCDAVIYLSNRTGQTDVWILDRRSGRSRQLRVPTAVERIDDASTDGSQVALQVVNESANLWRYDPRTRRHQPLTADTLPDYEPSAATGSPRIAFQRSRPRTEIHSRFLDARILVAEREGGLLSEPLAVGDGYAPALSPDGRRVAFLRTSAQGLPPYFTELWIGDLESGRTRKVSDRFQMTGFYELPAGLFSLGLAWLSGSELAFVEASADVVPELRLLELDQAETPPRALVALAAMEQILDLRASRAGEIAFLTRSLRGDTWELRVLGSAGDLTTPYSRELKAGTLSLAGESGAAGSWILLENAADQGALGRLEVLEVDREGGARTLGVVPHALATTAVLAPEGDSLYLTAARDGILNLVSLSLRTGEIEEVTDNNQPGVTFCGIEPLADASLVYSVQQRNADLWLLLRGTGTATTNS